MQPHKCKIDPIPDFHVTVDGKLRFRRMPMLNECYDCHEKITLTEEQFKNRLEGLREVLDMMKERDEN